MQLCSFTYEEKECEHPVGTPISLLKIRRLFVQNGSLGTALVLSGFGCFDAPSRGHGWKARPLLSVPHHRQPQINSNLNWKVRLSMCHSGVQDSYLGQWDLKILIIKLIMSIISSCFEDHKRKSYVPIPNGMISCLFQKNPVFLCISSFFFFLLLLLQCPLPLPLFFSSFPLFLITTVPRAIPASGTGTSPWK